MIVGVFWGIPTLPLGEMTLFVMELFREPYVCGLGLLFNFGGCRTIVGELSNLRCRMLAPVFVTGVEVEMIFVFIMGFGVSGINREVMYCIVMYILSYITINIKQIKCICYR